MISIFLILAIAAIVVFLDVPYMLRNKLKRELWASSVLLLIGAVIAIALAARAPIPSPLEAIKFVYKPMSDLFSKWLT